MWCSAWSEGPDNTSSRGSPLVTVWPGDRVTDEFAGRVNAAFVARQPADLRAGHRVRHPPARRDRGAGPLAGHQRSVHRDRVRGPIGLRRCAAWRGGTCRRRIALTSSDRLRVVAPADHVSGHRRRCVQPDPTTRAPERRRDLPPAGNDRSVAHRRASAEDRAALRRHAEMIARGARDAIAEPEDRRAVDERYGAAVRAIEEASVVRSGEDSSPPARS